MFNGDLERSTKNLVVIFFEKKTEKIVIMTGKNFLAPPKMSTMLNLLAPPGNLLAPPPVAGDVAEDVILVDPDNDEQTLSIAKRKSFAHPENILK